MLEDERGVDGAYGAILMTRPTARQRPSVFEFVANRTHVFETGWRLVATARRKSDIGPRRSQCANRVADQRSTVELHRRLVAVDATAMTTGEYCSDNAALALGSVAQFLPAV